MQEVGVLYKTQWLGVVLPGECQESRQVHDTRAAQPYAGVDTQLQGAWSETMQGNVKCYTIDFQII